MEQTITFPGTKIGTKSPGSNVKDINRSTLIRVQRIASSDVSISFVPDRVAFWLGAVALLLVFSSAAVLTADYLTGYNSVVIHKLVKLFDLDLEVNVPTFFSVGLLLTASMLLAVVTAIVRKRKGKHVLGWAILSGGFLFMAFDELASAHERLIEPMRAVMGIENLGIFYYAWVIPAIGLCLVLGVSYIKFLVDLPAKTRNLLMLAATMFLGGAVGLELFEGVFASNLLFYNVFVTFEECLEMGGVILLIWTLLRFLQDNFNLNSLNFDLSTGDSRSSERYSIKDLGLQS
ncbi:MAG TPA: hypothetical protein PLL77_13325 [Pyrinomonadaceae bacterium]|nr:hypothetical protein [Pyrinomonadaceae bacterium]